MRVVTAVLVGLVLVAAVGRARAEEVVDRTDFYLCSSKCDRDYESCMRRHTGKATEDCPGAVLKCRNACNPEWRDISRRAAAPVSCRDKCQASFDACTRADDGKHGGLCARDVMVCRDACPPEEPAAGTAGEAPAAEAAAAAPAAAVPPAAAPAAAPVGAAPAVAAAPQPEKIAPVERTPEPERASAPAPAIDKREPAPHPVPPERAAAASQGAAALPESTLHQAGPGSAGPQGATHASEPKRGVWERVWCSVFSCGSGATAQKPLSCEDACIKDYETCLAHADPKRGTDECASGSLRCRQGCEPRKTQ